MDEPKEEFTPISEFLGEKPADLIETKGSSFDTEKLIYVGAAVVGIAALALFFYFFVFSSQSSIVPEELTQIKLDYSLTLDDGTVIKEGKESFSEGFVGNVLGMSNAIDEMIKDLVEGEEIEFTLEADEAFGEYDEELILEINRTEKIPRRSEVAKVIAVPLDEFVSEFGEDPVVDKIYKSEGVPWDYIVVSFDDTEVQISQDAKVEDLVPLNDLFFLQVTEVNNEEIVTMMTAENQTIDSENGEIEVLTGPEFIEMTLTPEVGQEVIIGLSPQAGKVLSFDSEFIIIDYNSEYAGKEVDVKVEKI